MDELGRMVVQQVEKSPQFFFLASVSVPCPSPAGPARRPMNAEAYDQARRPDEANARRLHGHDDAGPPRSRIEPWLWWTLRPIHWLIMRLYFHCEVEGAENVPANGPVIISPTHRSRWDTLALYRATYRRMRFLTAREEFSGLQNWFMVRMGAFPVNPKRPAAGALRHCQDLLLEGQAVVVFPEGALYYYPPNHVHALKPGAAWLALECQQRLPDTPLTIVPVRLIYGDRVLKFRSRIKVQVRPPIALTPYLELPRKQAIVRLTEDLQRALGDVVSDVPPDVPVENPVGGGGEPRAT